MQLPHLKVGWVSRVWHFVEFPQSLKQLAVVVLPGSTLMNDADMEESGLAPPNVQPNTVGMVIVTSSGGIPVGPLRHLTLSIPRRI